MADMKRVNRMVEILSLIDKGGKVTAKVLAERFGVVERTVYTSSYESDGSCNYSPSGKHVYISENSGGYVCEYCGYENNYVSSGSCSYSPHRNYEYMAKGNNGYKCKFYGYENSYVSSGSCSYSSHGHHEYTAK